MFGVFKAKKRDESGSLDLVADELFSQIFAARNEAKEAEVIDEKIFNDRLNTMFTAGYLIGYVDSYLEKMADDVKRQSSERIFEKMFPGSGFNFVRAKLLTRQKAADLSPYSENYKLVFEAAQLFDKGMEVAQEEVEKYRSAGDARPKGLKDYLLLGAEEQ